MFHKYSNYSLDQFQYVASFMKSKDILLDREPNPELRRKMQGILEQGGYGSFTVNSDITFPDNPSQEAPRRLSMAGLLLTNPDVYNYIERNNAILFHGTNSLALPTILSNGLCSHAESARRGVHTKTGEYKFINSRRDFVSLTDQLNLAYFYSQLEPEREYRNLESYPILLGFCVDDFKNDKNSDIHIVNIDSDTPELGIDKRLPQQYIKFIAAPQDKLSEIQAQIVEAGLQQIDVLPYEAFEKASCIGDSIEYDFPINYAFSNEELTPVFNENDAKQVTDNRIISRIKQMWTKLKEFLTTKDKEDNTYDRDS